MKKLNEITIERQYIKALNLGMKYERIKQGKRLIKVWNRKDKEYEKLISVLNEFEKLLNRYIQVEGLAGFFIAGRKHILNEFQITPEKEVFPEKQKSSKEYLKETWEEIHKLTEKRKQLWSQDENG